MTKEVVKNKWLNIRLSDELLEMLRNQAESEHRSLSSQAVFIIENHFKALQNVQPH